MTSSMENTSTTKLCRGLVETPLGMLHYKYTGSLIDDDDDASSSFSLPILAFHMSPRSTDEYTEVMPLLSNNPGGPGQQQLYKSSLLHVDDHHRRLTETESCRRRRRRSRLFVAIDEPGYGDSDNPCRSCTLDEIADAYIHVANHLGIQEFVATGSLMGCYIALFLASRYANRVKAVICTNLYYYPHDKHLQAVVQQQQEEQEKKHVEEIQKQFPAIADSWEMHEDGSHLMALWNQRSSWLNAELNSRAVHDELTYLLKRRQRYVQGIHIQSGAAFDLARAAKNVACPVLIVMGAGAMTFFDAIGFAMSSQLELAKQLFPSMPQLVMIEEPPGGGSINLLNQNHQEWTRAVLQFLEEHVESK